MYISIGIPADAPKFVRRYEILPREENWITCSILREEIEALMEKYRCLIVVITLQDTHDVM